MRSSDLILIVDDDEHLAAISRLRLKAAGFESDIACDGDAGIEKAKQLSPKLILMDIHMPKVDGLTALNQIRSNPATADIPIIMVSGSHDFESTTRQSGAKGFIRKPFCSDEPVNAVSEVLQNNLPL